MFYDNAQCNRAFTVYLGTKYARSDFYQNKMLMMDYRRFNEYESSV